jgi:hypothetical protein
MLPRNSIDASRENNLETKNERIFVKLDNKRNDNHMIERYDLMSMLFVDRWMILKFPHFWFSQMPWFRKARIENARREMDILDRMIDYYDGKNSSEYFSGC